MPVGRTLIIRCLYPRTVAEAGIRTVATTPISVEETPRFTAVAPLWHTVLLMAVMTATTWLTARRISHLDPNAVRSHVPQYLQVIFFQWVLVAFIVWGLRRPGLRRPLSLRQLIGGRWQSFDEVLLDILIAAGYWIAGITLIAVAKLAMGMLHPSDLGQIKRAFGFIAPHGPVEIALWILLCINAGFCEEVIFRGYFQRQFMAWTGNPIAGIIAAGIVFGAAHLYQGGPQMILLALHGAMFGTLAYLRKSLRPGIIAHAWQDILTGLILSILTR